MVADQTRIIPHAILRLHHLIKWNIWTIKNFFKKPEYLELNLLGTTNKIINMNVLRCRADVLAIALSNHRKIVLIVNNDNDRQLSVNSCMYLSRTFPLVRAVVSISQSFSDFTLNAKLTISYWGASLYKGKLVIYCN